MSTSLYIYNQKLKRSVNAYVYYYYFFISEHFFGWIVMKNEIFFFYFLMFLCEFLKKEREIEKKNERRGEKYGGG